MILLIDNYDSFTYNLYQYFLEMKVDCRVIRNNDLTVSEIKKLRPSKIVLSPGPGEPSDAGVTLDVIRELSGKIPIVGVCLGHQAIGQAFGGRVIRAPRMMHGKTSEIFHSKKGVFKKLPSPFLATRYHSLIIEKKTLPDCLEITAKTKDGMIMGVRHKEFDCEGVQFHPESYATEHGKKLLSEFVTRKK